MRHRTSIGDCFMVLLFLVGPVVLGAEPEPWGNTVASKAQSNPTQATDTIRFKNGAVLHGLVTRFENGIFTVVIPGTQSQAMVHINDVERIEFAESAPSSTTQATPVRLPPAEPGEEKIPPTQLQKQEAAQSKPDQPASPPPQIDEQRQTTSTTNPSKSPETKLAVNSGTQSETRVPATQPGVTTPAPSVHEVTVSIPGREVWADSGLDVARGDQIRVSASGRVNLSRTQSTGPEGINIADPGKMMPNRPTGGLIAVIGDDNDDFVFVGQAAEIVAPRGGRLFLMVNENKVEDNTGAFTVRLQVQGRQKP